MRCSMVLRLGSRGALCTKCLNDAGLSLSRPSKPTMQQYDLSQWPQGLLQKGPLRYHSI